MFNDDRNVENRPAKDDSDAASASSKETTTASALSNGVGCPMTARLSASSASLTLLGTYNGVVDSVLAKRV